MFAQKPSAMCAFQIMSGHFLRGNFGYPAQLRITFLGVAEVGPYLSRALTVHDNVYNLKCGCEIRCPA